jgi:hypothetical protein
MRPYFPWLVSAVAALGASVQTAGVATAFVGGHGPSVAFHPSMAFHPRPPMFQRPAPGHQIAPLAQWGRNDGRWWRLRSRGFPGAWPVGGGWPYVSYSSGHDPYAYGYGFDPHAYGYGYPFAYGRYDSSDGYGYSPYAYGYGASYGIDDQWPEYDGPRQGYYGQSAAAPTYAVYPYRVAPSAKIIHLTPRQ